MGGIKPAAKIDNTSRRTWDKEEFRWERWR